MKTTLSTFEDDTAIFATHSDPKIASLNLQDYVHNMKKWLQKWKMKVKETKSTHITFTLRKGQCPPVCIHQNVIPEVETVKYLGLHFVGKLTWKEHIAMKRKQLDHKTRDTKWLIGKNSPLSLENKTPIYRTILNPIRTYGIEMWSCASKSNIAIIQRHQSEILRTTANAPWYVTNQILHTDLQIPYVSSVIHDRINKHHIALSSHHKHPVEPMFHPEHNRRLKRRWTFDLTD